MPFDKNKFAVHFYHSTAIISVKNTHNRYSSVCDNLLPKVNNICNEVVSNQPVCAGKPWSGTWCILGPCLPRNCQTSTCACTWNIYIHRSNVFYPGTAFSLRSSFGPVQMNLNNTNIWNIFVIDYTITYMKYWKLQKLGLKMHLEKLYCKPWKWEKTRFFYGIKKNRNFI